MERSLLGALPIYAQHLSEATGVKVVVQGHGAYTDGKTVVVPFVKNGDAQLTFGYLAHECSHVRNSDMDVFENTLATPMRKNLLNILEDIRIERRSMDEYPGTEEDIRYMNRKVLLEPFRPEHIEQAKPLGVIHNAVLFGAYWKLQEPQLETPAKAYLGALDDLVGQPLAGQLISTACRTLQCGSTQDVLVLVDEILNMLPTQEKPDPSDQPSNEPSGESGDDAQQGGNGESESNSPSGQPGEGDQGQPGESGVGDEESKTGSESGEKSPAGDSTSSNGRTGEGKDQGDSQGQETKAKGKGKGLDLRQMAMTASESDLDGLISDVGNAAGQMLNDKAQRYGIEETLPLAGRSVLRSDLRANRSIERGRDQSSGLRQVLGGLLQAQVDCRVRLKRQGLRLDGSRIAMLRAGESRVFRSKARAIKQSSAVQFLLDKSSSMNEAIVEAEAALYAVLAALEGLPLVTSGAISFPEQGKCSLIKAHNERLPAAVRAGGFGGTPNGFTPLGPALWAAATTLLASKQAKSDRKILFVITDGGPDDRNHAKAMVKRLETSGVEVIGLGFGGANDSVMSTIFTHYRVVGSVRRLRTMLFELVRGVLAA